VAAVTSFTEQLQKATISPSIRMEGFFSHLTDLCEAV